MGEIWDVIIIGGGPAGLTAGLYASRARLNVLLLEKAVIGGQITNAELVENYPGFPQGISGYELGELIHQQAAKYGLKTVQSEAVGLKVGEEFKLVRSSEDDYRARAVIIAGGSEHRKLEVPGEEELRGRGVSFCATCDAAFFGDKRVVVVGGGDSAVTEALFITKFASEVFLIHRRDQLRASKVLQERAFAHPKMRFIWDTVVEEIQGKNVVAELKLRQVKSGEKSALKVSGIFVSIGFKPSTEYVRGLLSLDEEGHIIANELMETSVPGIFAAGDIRHNSARQAVTAAGDGATAALAVERFLHQ